MRKKIVILLFILFFTISCTSEIGNPLAGSYRVSKLESDLFSFYYFTLKPDGTFILIQAGGNATSSPSILKGTYSFSLEHFDFINGAGTFTFEVKELPHNVEGLVMTEGNNSYIFTFSIDKNSGAKVLDLYPIIESSEILSHCFSINDSEFEKQLSYAMGEENV